VRLQSIRAPMTVRRDVPLGSWLLALGTAIGAFVISLSRFGSWVVDDALISIAYARTLTQTGGFAEQVGAPQVEGVSNLTWTLLLAALRAVGLSDRGHVWFGIDDYVFVVRAIAVVMFGLTVVAIGFAARAIVGARLAPLAAGIAGLILAISPAYVVSAASGLENPLYGLVVAILAAVLVSGVRNGTVLAWPIAVTCSLLVLFAAATRPDGLIHFAAYPVVAVLSRRRGQLARLVQALAIATVTFGAPAAAMLIWRHRVFGIWVPNTALAKEQQGITGASLARAVELLAAPGWALLAFGLVASGAALAAAAFRSRWRRRLWPAIGLVVPLLLAVVAFAVLTPDWMREYRFATPAAVTGSALVGVAVVASASVLQGVQVRRIVLLLTGCALLAALVTLQPRITIARRLPSAPGCSVVNRYGRIINAAGEQLGIARGSFLAPDIGGVLLTSNYRVVDLLGLTDATIARLRYERNWKGIQDYVLLKVKPTFVHFNIQHPGGGDYAMRRDPRFKSAYVPLIGGSDFVRKNAVPTGGDLGSVRATAEQGVRMLEKRRVSAPLARCGPLTPGQTRISIGAPDVNPTR
jgi:hypothetical protein